MASPMDKGPGTGGPPLISGNLRSLGGVGTPPRYKLGGPPLRSFCIFLSRGGTVGGAPHGQQTVYRGASPSFRTPPGIGTGWRPSAVQAQGGLPLVHPTRSLHPTCDRGASPYFKAIHGASDCRSCRQVPLPRRSEHRNGRRRPFPQPRRCLPFTPPSPSSRGPDRAPRRLR